MSTQDKKLMIKNTGLTLLSEGKTIRIKAHGYSMYPCIKPGSLVLIEPIHLKGAPVPGRDNCHNKGKWHDPAPAD